MSTGRRLASWFDRRRRVVLGATGAWIVVAAASGGDAPDDATWLEVPDLSAVLVVLAVLFAVVGLVVYVSLLGGERVAGEPRARRPLGYWLIALVAIGVVVGVRTLADDADDADQRDDETPEVPVASPADRGVTSGEADTRPVDRSDIIIAATIAAGATALWWGVRRSAPAALETQVDHAPAVGPAIDRAISHLELGTDPRTAVLRAYATLEDTLSENGRPRRDTETPSEHLRRSLRTLPVDHDELAELGLLYERARYSSGPTSSTDRTRALAILERARADLGQPRPADAEAGR